MKLGSIIREGGAGGGQAVKGRVGQGKEKGGAMQTRRVMIGRAARTKVWEERIEEEEEGAEGEEQIERRMREEVMGKQGGGGVSGCKIKTNEEIGVFDAERYFGGAEQQAGWVREEEEELMEGEAGGDLPLSPLVEFGKGKWRDQEVARGWAAPSFGRRRVESSEFASPRTSTASSLSEVEPPLQQRAPICQQTCKPKSKLQPASPSSRLASFLAKFKPPTPRKSPASSPILHLISASTPPPPRHPAPPSVLSPAKQLLPNSLLVLPHGKAPSPRGRFLRAFSSSSADHTSGAPLRHHASLAVTPPSMAVSSPVSPAARSAPPDPYSPITHSASTTPTSARIPRTGPHSISLPSHSYNSNSSSHSKPTSSAPSRRNSSGSFKQQLPFLSRKLKVYLMPDKAGADHSSKRENIARISSKSANGGAVAQGDLVRLRKHAPEDKQRRRWLYAEDQVVDEDIELAERLLRVVQDHQSSSHHHAGRSKPVINHAINSLPTVNRGLINDQHKSNNNIHGYADRVSEYSTRKYDQMHPTANTTSNLMMISPHANSTYTSAAGAAKPGHHSLMSRNNMQTAKEESGPYDSDSSSDLFEIETLASVGMGLHRRDLPVYEAKEPSQSFIEPSHSNHTFSFVSR